MEENAFDAVMGALKTKKPKQLRDETVREIRDALQMPRQEIMSLTLQQATQLLTGLLEDDRVQELSREDIHLTLDDVACSKPRKQRKDKGQPRGKRAKAEDVDTEDSDDDTMRSVTGFSMPEEQDEGQEVA